MLPRRLLPCSPSIAPPASKCCATMSTAAPTSPASASSVTREKWRWPAASRSKSMSIGSSSCPVPWSTRVLHGTGQELEPIDIDFERDAAGQRHFSRVTDEAEAGDVGAAVDIVAQHLLAGGAIEGEHGSNRRGNIGVAGNAAFEGGGDHAGAEALSEDQD